jgi:hypothetical protein
MFAQETSHEFDLYPFSLGKTALGRGDQNRRI